MSEAIVLSVLSRDQARSLTDEVKRDAEAMWRKLVTLYEGGAHTALGYSSWGDYFTAEFGQSRAQAYRLLDAGRVVASLTRETEAPNLRQSLELAPLLKQPETLKEAWSEVIEAHESPTAANVRAVVEQKVGAMSQKATINANAAKRKLYDALSSVSGYCSALSDFDLERALSNATQDDIVAWERLAGDCVRTLNQLRRAVKEAR